MIRKLKTSNDGSHTIYNETIDENYHSLHGAISESEHIFIKNALLDCKKDAIKIFEVGFGTGLNAYLSLIEAHKWRKQIMYEAIELYPLENSIIESLNYANLLPREYTNYYTELHATRWNQWSEISPFFSLKKIDGDILAFELSKGYDVVYFDAFSPEKQPELWGDFLFAKIFKAMAEGGVLTTYSAKGIVKRTLKEIGFKVELIPGPPGKRHMIRAIKP